LTRLRSFTGNSHGPGRLKLTFGHPTKSGDTTIAADNFSGMPEIAFEAVAIVTPNHMHAPVADAFLDAGVHIICDKPLTTTLGEARRLRDKARTSGLIFAVTYNYSGYPLVRHARSMVQGGELGAIRIVQVEYPQDWLADPLEATGQKQADWRTDPARSGAGGCVGDIGTHAYQLAHFVTGMMRRFWPRRPSSCRAAVSMTTCKFCCVTGTGRGAHCGRARLHPETITGCGYGSSVRRAVWTDDRKSRTFSSGRRSVKHHGRFTAAQRP
jgi:predicted dehydrogenase